MDAFARLLDSLYFTQQNKGKRALIHDYLRHTPDPERGWAIAAIANSLTFPHFKRNLIKQLVLERVDPVLFELSYEYVGETSETVAHLWPQSSDRHGHTLPGLTEVVTTLMASDKTQTAEYLRALLDNLSASQRWALIKLGTKGLRIGVSERFLKSILADYGGVELAQIETLWHGLEPPYTDLLLWLEGQGEIPDISDKQVYHPVMLSHPVDEHALPDFTPDAWQAEWKYDGIRVQLNARHGQVSLFSRTGEDLNRSFPDLLARPTFHAVLDAELLVMRDGNIGSFNQLQQRLNKKKPAKRLMQDYPVGLMVYDLIFLNGEDLSGLPLADRRARLEEWHSHHASDWLKLSPVLEFTDNQALLRYRQQCELGTSSCIEGLMLKRLDTCYVSGRPKGQWYKWKRTPMVVDAVIMYAQRGHGKRSSFFSDYTFGLWQDDQILPIGKAYSGFTDDELKQLDRWIRNNTTGRFGPVREVKKELVFEVAFDAVHPSGRHKSGYALRFPRIKRIRWDKPAKEADKLDYLKSLVQDNE